MSAGTRPLVRGPARERIETATQRFTVASCQRQRRNKEAAIVCVCALLCATAPLLKAHRMAGQQLIGRIAVPFNEEELSPIVVVVVSPCHLRPTSQCHLRADSHELQRRTTPAKKWPAECERHVFKPELTVTWSIIELQCDDNASLGRRRLSKSCSRWHSVVSRWLKLILAC